MSHLHERKEKVCLNCNAAIYGRFCHVCGQENIEPQESFWHLTSHFVGDLFHYDGKFLSTLKSLIFRPGFLAKEHLRGRRADYLHPIRLYIFISAFFFLIIFGFYAKHEQVHKAEHKSYKEVIKELEEKDKKVKNFNKVNKEDRVTNSNSDNVINKITQQTDSAIRLLQKDTTATEQALLYAEFGDKWLERKWQKNLTKEIYLDSQNRMAVQQRDNFFDRRSTLLQIAIKEKSNQQNIPTSDVAKDLILHNVPKCLFLGLPIYALVLLLVYIRKRQSFKYVDHLIFSIHLFCFTFLLILFSLWLNSLSMIFKLDIAGILNIVSPIIAMLYTYKGLRNFYEQSRGKTILKFLILSISCIFLSILILSLAFGISLFTA